MIFTIQFFLLFPALLDQNSILEKASEKGFFYRNADIYEVEKCSETETCVEHSGKNYVIKKKDRFEVSASVSQKAIEIEITPDNSYISYFIYIQHKAGVHRIQMNKKKLVIDQGVANIIKLQIVGTASTGPKVIWEKPLKKTVPVPFSRSFDESVHNIRKTYFQKPLVISEELKPAAEESLKRLKNEGLVHYSSKTGSVRHTGIDKKVLGENLFIAESEEKAWKMLVNSPSHLYNLINPHFKKYFVLFTKNDEETAGVILFSE
ncbi:MAG TPA: hypothetical protein PLX56_05080 [bacterium]|nr:hypothetical protein [bacterium]